MKYMKIFALITAFMLVGACTFDFPDSAYAEPEPGSADFSKTISVGSSLTAGFMNGALYTDGQNASFAKILATQMALAGGGAFNQPDIGAVNGCYNPLACAAAGRLYLKGLTSPRPTPKTPGDAITPYGGVKAELNNFSAFGIPIQLSLAAATSGPIGNPFYNPYFARFASSPSTNGTTGSSLVSDAAAAMADGGTFFTFWLGTDDALAYALNGADQNDATRPLTSTAAFTAAYTAAITAILNANTRANGVIANIPDITSLPHFSTVTYNPIPLDATNSGALNTGFAGYNAAIEGLKNPAFGGAFGTAAQLDARKVSFITGNNKILIIDEDAQDLGSGFDALQGAGAITPTQRAQLEPFRKVRQTTAADLVPLGTSAVLGTAGGFGLLGLSEPLADKYILIPSEITAIQNRITEFNNHIASVVTTNTSRVALVDVKTILANLKAGGITINGSGISASITPPFGGFSLDGVHPNARGTAYLANKFIEVINAKWGASIPYCNPNDFRGNELPVP